jgi:molybdopterin-guanine dinucleotide biosynthesis protein A
MRREGFVLAGGRSARMGRDKALLEIEGIRLISRAARVVEAAAGSTTLIGDPQKYGGLGYPVHPDIFMGCGPLAGIHAALSVSSADWNLVLACDMPEVESGFLINMLERAEQSGQDCLLPAGKSGRPEPLCGVYHRCVLPAIQRALEDGVRKVLDGLAGLRVEVFPVSGPGPFRNINTPAEWNEYTRAQTNKTRDRRI